MIKWRFAGISVCFFYGPQDCKVYKLFGQFHFERRRKLMELGQLKSKLKKVAN